MDKMAERVDALAMWTVYDRPRDYPDVFVARKWLITGNGPVATSEVITAISVEALRSALPVGLVRLERMKDDDVKILEVWL